MNSDFSYKHLNTDEREVRFLHIDNNNSSPDNLNCHLAHFSLDDHPPFTALSYAWSDPTLIGEHGLTNILFIQLEGQKFQVGHNLGAALVYFHKNVSGWLWIDAICINQNDIDERGSQVLLMGAIYTQAQSVLVWLGRETHQSNLAVELIKAIGEIEDTVHASDWIMNSLNEEARISAWRSVHHLFERSWWTRVWIRQEAALAQSVEMAIGDHKLSWEALERFIVNMSAVFHGFSVQLLHRHQIVIDHKALNALMTLQNLRKARLNGDKLKYGILNNLMMTLHSRCTDDRDRIYGIVGLSSDATVEKPDYRLSAREIFQGFTKSYLEGSKQLDIMLIDTQPREAMNLPSWAPDWGSEGTGRIAISTTWSHAARYRTLISFSDDNNVLTSEGVCIGDVDGCGYDFSTPRTDPSGMVVLPQHNANFYKTDVEGFRALWSSIIANKSRYAGGESMAPNEFGAIFVELCRVVDGLLGTIKPDQELQPFREGSTEFEKWFQRNWNFTFAGRTLRSWALDEKWEFNIKRSEGEDARAAADSFEATCMHMSRNRRLITSSGGFIGHAPTEVQPGDAIYVLSGCSVPVVLRKIGDQYRLLGECYVHGIMNGEAFFMGKDITDIEIV